MATGAGTGTPITDTAALTLSDLRAACRRVLASTSDWSNDTLDNWIREAMRMYSMQLPRRWRYTLTLTTGTQAYAIPGGHGFQGIISVEYPAGLDPPEFVELVPAWHRRFSAGHDVYALRGIVDTTDITADETAATIVFAETVATGETAAIEYRGDWPLPAVGNDTEIITIPAAHTEALITFVDFRAHWELETDEAYAVSTVSIVLAQLGEEARRAWSRYKDLMNAITESVPVPPHNPGWANIGL